MLTALFFGVAALAQASADTPASPPSLDRQQSILCSCAAAAGPDLILEGLVVDAEMTLGADGRSANDAQATIFNVLKTRAVKQTDPLTGARIRVLHTTSPKSCGVTFDYGKRYAVPVRKTEAGELETDFCLLTKAAPPEAAAQETALEMNDDPRR